MGGKRRNRDPAVATLCCGTSGTGKTTYVKRFLTILKLPLILVNGGDEYRQFSPQHKDLTDNFKDLKNCTIVVEDFVKQTDGELKKLLKILGYLKRHNRCFIFINSYMITSTGASSMLALFDNVVFSKSVAIRRSMLVFASRVPVAGFDEKMIDSFLNNGKSRYLKLDLKTQQISVLSDNFEVISRSDTRANAKDAPALCKKKQEFEGVCGHVREVFQNFPESQLLYSIFTFVRRNIEELPQILNPKDLTITLKTSRKNVAVSLLDFVLSLREESEPDPNILRLYKYFSARFHFPKCFIKNTHIRELKK